MLAQSQSVVTERSNHLQRHLPVTCIFVHLSAYAAYKRQHVNQERPRDAKYAYSVPFITGGVSPIPMAPRTGTVSRCVRLGCLFARILFIRLNSFNLFCFCDCGTAPSILLTVP